MKKQLRIIYSIALLLGCVANQVKGDQARLSPSQDQYMIHQSKKPNKKKIKTSKPYPRGDVKSVKGFDRFISSRKRVRVVVLFYMNDGAELEAMVRMFDRLDRSDRYREAGVRFLTTNLSRGDLNQLIADFQIRDPQVPCVVMFEDGVEIARDRRVRGFLEESDMRSIVEDRWGKAIDQIIKEKEEERERRALQWLYYGSPYWYGYPYYGYPGYYYGFPYYYGYGPRFGIGWGVTF